MCRNHGAAGLLSQGRRIGRTGDGGQVRLYLINYGGGEFEGVRVRLRRVYGDGEARVGGAGPLQLQERVIADGATEFSVPRIATCAVVDLKALRRPRALRWPNASASHEQGGCYATISVCRSSVCADETSMTVTFA
jgi:hypothetical protein